MSVVTVLPIKWDDFRDQHGIIDLARAFQATFPHLALTHERQCYFHTISLIWDITSRQIATIALATAVHCIGSH